MMIDDELHDISVQFGYYSNRDGEYWNFHLCEDCLVEITKVLSTSLILVDTCK